MRPEITRPRVPRALGLGNAVDLPALQGSATLADKLYEVLELAIIEGRLAPGERLQADEIAQHFGVSRIPVRETLRALDAAGWIDIRPRHGSYVRQRSVDEVGDLFEVRAILEAKAARLASQRRTDAQLEILAAVVSEGREAATGGRVNDVAAINAQFHQHVAACTQNLVLQEMLGDLSQRVRWYFSTVGDVRGPHSMEEHGQMVEALRVRDEEKAARLAVEHVGTTRAAIEQAVAVRLEPVSTRVTA